MGFMQTKIMLNLQSLNCFMTVISFCSTGGLLLVTNNSNKSEERTLQKVGIIY